MSNFDIRWNGTAECTVEQERTAGITGRSPKRELLALLRFQFREPLENERLRLIAQFGDQRQVIATEAVGIVILVSVIYVSPGSGNPFTQGQPRREPMRLKC